MGLKRNLTIIFFISFIAGGTLFIQRCRFADTSKNTSDTTNKFVGDQQCRTCHAEQYKLWTHSDHFKAMMPANDSTISGNFNNQTLTANGVTSRFFKKDGKYYINTDGEDGVNADFEIKYTFGYYPLQQYLVEFPGGKMQATRASWDVKNKKWYDQYAGQKIPAHNWIHWTGNGQNWNTMCANCHSTNLQKNYNSDSDTYHTSFSSINVSCETCHGAGGKHISYIQGEAYKNGDRISGSYILLKNKGDQISEINACAVCHARRAEIKGSPTPGAPFMDNYIPEIPTTEHFYADGQANDEDYNYTSFSESKMFSRGVRCTNCHEPHEGKLRFTGNQLCMQCHGRNYNTEAHSFHSAGSSGSECRSCHMPSKDYMGIDTRYDHTFRVPRPDLSITYGTPNACNNCHQDKTAKWAADAVSKWYGPKRNYHFAEDLIPGSKSDEQSESHLIKLTADTSVPDIVRASAANYLGNRQTGNSLYALLNCLKYTDANIRYRAVKSLAGFPAEKWIYAVAPLFSDSIRAVRIAAAELFMAVPQTQFPTDDTAAFTKAKAELDTYIFYQSDFSVGDIMIGDYYLKQNDYSNAEKYYNRGLKKDPLMNYARLNLSVVYNMLKQNDQALHVLKDAAKLDPTNERVYYNMALLYNEMGDKGNATKSLAEAVSLKSFNPRVYYNYGLMLEHDGRINHAIDIYKKGIALSPADASLNYALALLYIKTGKKEEAKIPASQLKKYYPEQPEYQKMFEFLKLNSK